MTDSNSEIVRLSCVNQGCGTFPMDRALYDQLRQTGNTFTCPDGHEQHFSESPLKKKDKKINQLKSKLDRIETRMWEYREQCHEMWDEQREIRQDRDHLEKLLLERVHGVIEVREEEYKWSCPCGSQGRETYVTAAEARKRFKKHQRRKDCENGITEEVVEA